MITVSQEDHRKIARFDALLPNYQKALVKIVHLEDEIHRLTKEIDLWKSQKRDS
jgi:hypothetical protein